MKQFFTLLFVLLIFSDAGFSQSKTRYSYLTVTLRSRHDGLNGAWYLELVTDKGNPNSAFIDSLINYKTRVNVSTSTRFYYERKDSSHQLFNYFKSVAESLEFLEDHDWQLFSIVPITSSSGSGVSTDPLYYLRKEK